MNFPDAFDADEIIPAREGYIVKQQRRAYCIGAAEQKAIDDAEYRKDMAYLATRREELIDKACEVFKRFMQVQYGEDIDESMEMYFRKAMEDKR